MALPELRGVRLVECPSRHRRCHKYELTPCTRITRSRSPLRSAAYWPFSGSWLSPPQSVRSAGSEQRRVNTADELFAVMAEPAGAHCGPSSPSLPPETQPKKG